MFPPASVVAIAGEQPIAVACPFTWSLDDRLADVRRRATRGAIQPERWHASP
jgi:aminoglycoside phosphotransferase